MIIAIDPGLNNVGWAIIKSFIDSGVIRVKGNTLQEKLVFIRGALCSQFSLRGPGVCIIEMPGKITYARSQRGGKSLNMDSIHKLCMATGVIIVEMARLGYDIEFMVADEWKRSFCRRQFAAGKDYFLAVARQIAGREVKTDHEADAVCLAWWYVTGKEKDGRNADGKDLHGVRHEVS